ncbi:MAG: hypothetical protein ACUVWP_07330 [bacterium]
MWIYQYDIISGTNDIQLKNQFKIYHYRSDLNGFCYVTENSNKYIWTTRCNFEENKPQLWQLNLNTGSFNIEVYRGLELPSNYYPTGITLDNSLNIYFIDGMNRKAYKINYSAYSGETRWIEINNNQITELFTVPLVNNNPSIPMGIQYYGLGYFYITLAGKEDYIIKTDINGNLLNQKNLHDYINEEHKSRMPTDLTIDGSGYIWYTDCDYDKLYKIEKE